MILYVNGDSNSDEHGTIWVEKVKSHFNAQLINHSQGGGSNPRILRTTHDFFEKSTEINDIFVIIGWTSWEREEWLHQDQYIQVNASGLNIVPKGLQDRYKSWVNDSESISQINKSRSLHSKIFDLHIFFKQKRIRHLFFNALMPFQHEVLSCPESRLDWGGNFLGPYDNNLSYYWFLQQYGYQPDKHNHYGPPAQMVWGEFLIKYITEKNLIK